MSKAFLEDILRNDCRISDAELERALPQNWDGRTPFAALFHSGWNTLIGLHYSGIGFYLFWGQAGRNRLYAAADTPVSLEGQGYGGRSDRTDEFEATMQKARRRLEGRVDELPV